MSYRLQILHGSRSILPSGIPAKLKKTPWSLDTANPSSYYYVFKWLYSPNFISRFLKVWTIRNTNYIVTYTFGPLELWATFKEQRYLFIVLEPKFNMNTNLYTKIEPKFNKNTNVYTKIEPKFNMNTNLYTKIDLNITSI